MWCYGAFLLGREEDLGRGLGVVDLLCLDGREEVVAPFCWPAVLLLLVLLTDPDLGGFFPSDDFLERGRERERALGSGCRDDEGPSDLSILLAAPGEENWSLCCRRFDGLLLRALEFVWLGFGFEKLFAFSGRRFAAVVCLGEVLARTLGFITLLEVITLAPFEVLLPFAVGETSRSPIEPLGPVLEEVSLSRLPLEDLFRSRLTLEDFFPFISFNEADFSVTWTAFCSLILDSLLVWVGFGFVLVSGFLQFEKGFGGLILSSKPDFFLSTRWLKLSPFLIFWSRLTERKSK